MNTLIPKIIHLSWKDKNLLESDSPLVTEGVKKLIELNPEWEVTIYDDDEIDGYLKDQLESKHYALIADKHVVQKTDLWRLIKLYIDGGLYMDIDRFCNTPLNALMGEKTKWVVPTCRDYDFSHDFMMTSPDNPVYLYAASLYVQRLLAGHENIYYLGPQTYMHAITKIVFGSMVNTNPKPEIFNEIKEQMKASGFIKTYEEDPPYDTIIYRNGALALNWEAEKRKLYADSGLRHWSNEW